MTTPAEPPLPPGSTIGILGGGQLGRMLALAAARLGLRCHVLCPDSQSPAFEVAARFTVADYEDREALAAFAGSVDVVTYEFENVPVMAAEWLAERVPVRPGPRALAVSQDRLAEKAFIAGLGIPVAPHRAVDDTTGLQAAIKELGLPAVLKTRRLGYDGKGQAVIRAGGGKDAALAAMRGASAILEGFVSFQREISVIAARGVSGDVVAYDPAENVHRHGILHTSTVPAQITPATAEAAADIAGRILDALGYVGTIGVEFFVTGEGPDERLVVNEIAPRVHNSGHWTEDACAVSQFENHIRAVAGWPLGGTERHSDAVMTNLIGAEADDWQSIAADGAAGLHLYGKAEARAGRKMGHVNRLRPLGATGNGTLAIDHVQLAMPPGGEAEARRFYAGLLGIPEVAKPAELAGRGGCWFEHGAARVHLGVEEGFRPARKAHPALVVGNLEAVSDLLRQASHAVRPDTPFDGRPRLHTDDPFGNRIELIERAGRD